MSSHGRLPLTHLLTDGAFAEHSPLFVTWNKDDRLRGCIGTFSSVPLRTGLSEFALTSGFSDHRFKPISTTELRQLSCAVSLLTQFEDCSDHLDWRIGTHGIYITLPAKHGQLTATFLPDVIPEQQWSQLEAIDSAIRKAGYNGRITDQLRSGLRVQRYQSQKTSCTYQQYQAWKQAAA